MSGCTHIDWENNESKKVETTWFKNLGISHKEVMCLLDEPDSFVFCD